MDPVANEHPQTPQSQELHEFHARRAVLASIGACVLFGLAFFIIYLRARHIQEVTTPPAPKQIVNTSSHTTTQNTNPETDKRKIYTDDSFLLSYPADWKVSKNIAVNGKVIIFSSPSSFPNLTVEQIQGDASAGSKLAFYTGLGFATTGVKIGEMDGIQAKGVITDANPKIQETAVLVKNGATLFRFQFDYKGNYNSTQEQLLQILLSSVQFIGKQ